MSIWKTVGSFRESHRAKSQRPDRRSFLPQTGQLPSVTYFLARLPQLRSIVPNAPPAVPNFPVTIPFVLAALPIAKAPVPILRMAVPSFPTIFPNFSASLPTYPEVFPTCLATFPNFSTAARIYNGLFHSPLSGIQALHRQILN